jgi:hypothetical protein
MFTISSLEQVAGKQQPYHKACTALWQYHLQNGQLHLICCSSTTSWGSHSEGRVGQLGGGNNTVTLRQTTA